MGGLTYTELGVIAIALICIIIGLAKGFSAQLLNILDIVVLAAACIFGIPWLGATLNGAVPALGESINGALSQIPALGAVNLGLIVWYIISFFIIYILCSIIMSILKKLAQKMVKPKILNRLDKILGIVFSLAIFYVFLSVLLAVASNLDTFVSLIGIDSDLGEIITAVDGQINGGVFLSFFAGENNFIGNALLGLLEGLI